MLQPLAIVFYERLMPGSQLVNRLQDLNYRVLAINNAARLAATVQRESPLLLFVDLATPGDVCGSIAKLKAAPETAHLPVIGFAPETAPATADRRASRRRECHRQRKCRHQPPVPSH